MELSETNIILESFETFKLIVSWIREIKNKHNINNKRIDLYIDLLTKEVTFCDLFVVKYGNMFKKINMGNCENVEFSLFNLFNSDYFFESKNINGYNCYLSLPMIERCEKENEIKEEINRLNEQIVKSESKLQNNNFKDKAPVEIINQEEKKILDIKNKIDSLNFMLFQSKCGKEYYGLLLRFGDLEKIKWHIQYLREKDITEEIYSKNWFKNIYNKEFTEKEIKELHYVLCKY